MSLDKLTMVTPLVLVNNYPKFIKMSLDIYGYVLVCHQITVVTPLVLVNNYPNLIKKSLDIYGYVLMCHQKSMVTHEFLPDLFQDFFVPRIEVLRSICFHFQVNKEKYKSLGNGFKLTFQVFFSIKPSRFDNYIILLLHHKRSNLTSLYIILGSIKSLRFAYYIIVLLHQKCNKLTLLFMVFFSIKLSRFLYNKIV